MAPVPNPRALARARAWLPRGRGLAPAAWQARHRAVLMLVWAHVVVVPAYGALIGRGVLHSCLDAVPILFGGLAASRTALPQRLRAVSSTFALVSASAALVHLS